MGAAEKTRQMLAQALKELMKTSPLEKISVGDITQQAGVGRNTFYYHYDDIPALLADTLEAEFAKTADAGQGDPLLRLLTMVAGHRQVFAHIDHSQSREILRRRLYQAMETNVRHTLEDGSALSQAQRDTLAVFFAGGIWSLFRSWLEDGAQETPEAFLDRISAVQQLMQQAVSLTHLDT